MNHANGGRERRERRERTMAGGHLHSHSHLLHQRSGNASTSSSSNTIRYGLALVLALNVASEGLKARFASSSSSSSVDVVLERAARGKPNEKPAVVNVAAPRLMEEEPAISTMMRKRECGSPAIDGYAHVNATCLLRSATAREYDASAEARAALEASIETHASYDGIAVRWGINHTVDSAEECAEKCRRHVAKEGGRGADGLPCNVFVWCPKNEGLTKCFEPDAHEHYPGDCWLKFSETPENVEVNQRGANDAAGFTNAAGRTYRERHPDAPALTHWTSGVMLPPGVKNTGGTLGPRATW